MRVAGVASEYAIGQALRLCNEMKGKVDDLTVVYADNGELAVVENITSGDFTTWRVMGEYNNPSFNDLALDIDEFLDAISEQQAEDTARLSRGLK